jgi:hypothetical protein
LLCASSRLTCCIDALSVTFGIYFDLFFAGKTRDGRHGSAT